MKHQTRAVSRMTLMPIKTLPARETTTATNKATQRWTRWPAMMKRSEDFSIRLERFDKKKWLLRSSAGTDILLFVLLHTCLRQEWEALQQSIQRRERALLETKSKVTHPVYSLYFPEEKQEWWWLYIADRRDQALVSMPCHVCTLKDTEEVSVFLQQNVTMLNGEQDFFYLVE